MKFLKTFRGGTMTDARQKPISINSRDRDVLNQQKARYEESTGKSTDWGDFLGTVALLGLAAVGVYMLAKAIKRSPRSVDVKCSGCDKSFVMAVPEGTPRAIYTTCPHCQEELVVDLGTS